MWQNVELLTISVMMSNNIFLLLYLELTIYLKYITPHIILKISKMCEIGDVSGNFYDGEPFYVKLLMVWKITSWLLLI